MKQIKALGIPKIKALGLGSTAGLGSKKEDDTEVIVIELLDKLDDGSKNDGNNKELETTIKKGLLFGKKYRFKIKSFTNGIPKNKSDIKWLIKYHSPIKSQNKWVEKKLSATGDNISILFDDKDMCGRFVYVRAYIFDDKQEAEIKLWKHNRFRWFDKETFDEELKDRTDDKKPYFINQSGTSLCGMACIFYLFAKEQPDDYANFSKELFRTGEAKFNNYTVKPSIELLEKKVDTLGYPLDTDGMPLIDYVTLAGTKNTYTPKYKGGSEKIAAINWPPMMEFLSKNFLGYKTVTIGFGVSSNRKDFYKEVTAKEIIEDINKQIIDGFNLMLLIDSDLIDDEFDFKSVDFHWVVLLTPISIKDYLNSFGEIVYNANFTVFSWGTDIKNPKKRLLKNPISLEHFYKNFYGYIKVK